MPAPSSPSPEQPPWLVPRATYIHIPFCAHHCGYCDFAVVAGRDDKMDQYLLALEAELAALNEPRRIDTLFLGGGTPTHLGEMQLARLLALIRKWLVLNPGGEFTVESNPGTLTRGKVVVLAEYGLNRVSLGSQSFQPHLLAALERDHQPADVPCAVEIIRKHIPQFSLDLIFGVPNQSRQDWQDDLRQALALAPDHLSTYGLTFEKGTRLWKQRRAGDVRQLDEEAELAMYFHGIDTLSAAGFEHYEISNFARPGKRSRHNQVYWANHAYFGFGMGAARYVNGRRELNTRSLDDYLRRALAGETPTIQSEVLPKVERARETIALNLRRAEGVNFAQFLEQTGFDLLSLVGPVVEQFVQSGHLQHDKSGIRLTRQGKAVADYVIQKFWH